MTSNLHEIRLKPYHGRLFYATTKAAYEQAHLDLFSEPEVLTCAQAGRFVGGNGKDGLWTYLMWAKTEAHLAHEICHILFHVWERCGMDPRDSGGEAFCYMLSQILLDAKECRKGGDAT
jgi:hypothetical protein